jgi:hypothetical protein
MLPLLHDLLPNTLKCQGNLLLCTSRPHGPWSSLGNRRLKTAGFIPCAGSSCCGSWTHTSNMQASELPLPWALGLLCLQQPLWHLEAHIQAQIDPDAALSALEESRTLPLLPHGHPQLATQWQEPTATCTSESQAPWFAVLLVSGGFPPQRTWRPSAHHQAFPQECPHCPAQEQALSFSTEW